MINLWKNIVWTTFSSQKSVKKVFSNSCPIELDNLSNKREANKPTNEISVLENWDTYTALHWMQSPFGGLTEWFKVKKSDISVCVFKNQKRREALNLSKTNAYWKISSLRKCQKPFCQEILITTCSWSVTLKL